MHIPWGSLNTLLMLFKLLLDSLLCPQTPTLSYDVNSTDECYCTDLGARDDQCGLNLALLPTVRPAIVVTFVVNFANKLVGPTELFACSG